MHLCLIQCERTSKTIHHRVGEYAQHSWIHTLWSATHTSSSLVDPSYFPWISREHLVAGQPWISRINQLAGQAGIFVGRSALMSESFTTSGQSYECPDANCARKMRRNSTDHETHQPTLLVKVLAPGDTIFSMRVLEQSNTLEIHS